MSEMAVVHDVEDEEDDEIARLEAEISSKRERVATSLGELRERWHDATSWRHWVRSHPVSWLGAGLCLGFIVGYGARRGRRLE
jgi:hypothetical protein